MHLGSGTARSAIITPALDSNNFFTDPSSAVDFAVDGLSLVVREDPEFSSVIVSNDPGLGDPIILIPVPGAILSFNYDFVVGSTQPENDEFGAFLLDSAGNSAGGAFEFFTSTSGSGSVTFDLSSFVGDPFVGIQFQLSSLPGDGGMDSFVTISNLQLETPGSTVVPEPSTLMMFLGLAACAQIAVVRRRRDRQLAQDLLNPASPR